MKHFTLSILKWYANFYVPGQKERNTRIIQNFHSVVTMYTKTKGLAWTIKRLKLVRLHFTRYLCGKPLQVSKEMIGLTNGIPKSFLFLRELVDSGTKQDLRFLLSILNVSRSMEAPGTVSYDTITDPFTGTMDTIDPKFIKQFADDFRLHVHPTPLTYRDLFFTFKSGPLGNQVVTCINSLMHWTGSALSAAQHLVSTPGVMFIKNLRDRFFDKSSKKLIEKINNTRSKVQGFTRKLSVVHDPELKERIICIFDYFSQVCLEPLSKQCFEQVKNLPQDRTFTQDPIILKEDSECYYSFDLHAATDRFPIQLQEDLMTQMSGSRNFGYAWRSMLTKQRISDLDGNPIQYSVGQPMGARSSWIVFTLSHHLVVQYSAFLIGEYPTKKYILLGDDIVITCDKLAASYKEVVNNLGVEISDTKTHISENCYEFAKRWFKDGVEISGIPMRGLVDSAKQNLMNLLTMIRDLYLKGYYPCSTNLDEAIESQLSNIGIHPKRRISIMRKFELYRLLIRNASTQGFNPDEVRSFFVKATANNEYNIPSCEVELRKEFLRILNFVYQQSNYLVLNDLNRLASRTTDKIKEDILDETVSDSDIQFHPIVAGIYNSIVSLQQDTVVKMNLDDIQLKVVKLSTVDPSMIGSRRRDILVKRDGLNIFIQKVFVELRDYPDYEIRPAQFLAPAKAAMDVKRMYDKLYSS